jgi:hypothetical protein
MASRVLMVHNIEHCYTNVSAVGNVRTPQRTGWQLTRLGHCSLQGLTSALSTNTMGAFKSMRVTRQMERSFGSSALLALHAIGLEQEMYLTYNE